MKVMVPVAVTPTMLIETNAPASAEAEWAVGTAYAIGARVQVDGRRRYEALVATTGHAPATNPSKWLDIGASNPWAPFDGVVGSYAAGGEDYDDSEYNAEAEPTGLDAGLAYRIAPGQVWDTLVLLGLQGRMADVVVRDGEGATVFAQRTLLDGALPVSDWWHWLFSPIESLNTAVVTWADMSPVGADGEVYISVVAPDGGSARIGNILLGLAQWVGDVQYPAEVGDVDFSTVEEDAFGHIDLVPRAWSSRAELTLVLPEDDVAPVFRRMASLRATAAVWIADPDPRFSPAVIYGIRRRFSLSYATAGTAYLSLSLRGLV